MKCYYCSKEIIGKHESTPYLGQGVKYYHPKEYEDYCYVKFIENKMSNINWETQQEQEKEQEIRYNNLSSKIKRGVSAILASLATRLETLSEKLE